jgi:periplasmic divalent cation tolerance protein
MRTAVIMTTVANGEDARALTTDLLERRLAACVQEISITSRYRWQGSLVEEPERMLFLKTTADREPGAVARIEEIHPYEVPEVLVVEAGSTGPYLAWLNAETRPPGR